MRVSHGCSEDATYRKRICLCAKTYYIHPRVQQPYKFIGTKESLNMREKSISHRIGLGIQHGCHFIALGHQYGTLRGSLLFLLGERREEPLLATARFFDLTAVHGQGRINLKNQLLTSLKWVLNLRMADVSQNAG